MMRDRWFSSLTPPKDVRRQRNKLVKDLSKDGADARVDGTEDQRDPELQRDIVPDDSEDEEADQDIAPLHWVPYVHYGV